MPRPGAALAPVGEFGPFDVLSEWAYRAYVEGYGERAVRACREALLVVEPAGDVQTARYLRYIEGITLLELGRRREAVTAAMDLLTDLDATTEPLWRAKGLALLAESSVGVGELKRATEALAEGYWLVSRHPAGRYNHVSASMAVAIALRSVFLFEQSEELFTGLTGFREPSVLVQLHQERAVMHAHWAAVLELLGHHEEARPHFVRCYQSALSLCRLAGEAGEQDMAARGEVIAAFAMSALGETALAAARVRGADWALRQRSALLERILLHLVLGRDLAARGEVEAARRHLRAAGTGAERTGRDVWAATAVAALADVDVLEHGRHPAVGLWKRLFREAMQRMWSEREARFAALTDRNRLRDLAEEHRRVGRENLADPLTGLGNRRMMAQSVRRADGLLSVVFLDVDSFKEVNDRFSHAVGDEVLQRFAELLRQNCRPQDDVIRFGGDEFVVLVRGDEGAAVADEIGHRLHEAVRTTDWGLIAEGLVVTASIGVASASDAEKALAAADAALYDAKRSGRDRVVAA